MPFRFPVVSLIVAAGIFSLAFTAHAQHASLLWIQSVTVDAAAGTATITGTGFSETCAVTLDGHALTVVPGGTATRLVVVVPASLLATPGTYRLTVTDAGRQAGDAFEITIAERPEVGLTAADRSGVGARQAPAISGDGALELIPPGEVVGTRLVEDDARYNSALGHNALVNNTIGTYNTAGGAFALGSNTVGLFNTAVGGWALASDSNGQFNTALGYFAGYFAVGTHNILIGSDVRGGTESNTLRLGLPYNPAAVPVPAGISRTFVAGIRGTTVSGATPVGVDANGQLGMADKLGAGAGYGCATCYQNGTIELYNPGTGDMTLQSGPDYRLLLNPSGGHVGIGVNSLLGAGLGYGCTTCYQQGTIELYNPGTGNLTIQGGSSYDLLLNPGGGNIGIGIADAQYPLHLGSGAHVTAGGVWTNASSRVLKDDITPLTLERAQAALVALAPVEYVYKADPSERQVGFIAEDVPALVAQNDRASLSPMDLVAVLTKVVQAQQAQLATQQAQLAALQDTVDALQAQRQHRPQR
jgi:hypothetical protein